MIRIYCQQTLKLCRHLLRHGLLLCFFHTGCATAADIVIKNGDFSAWNMNANRPEAWSVSNQGGQLGRECPDTTVQPCLGLAIQDKNAKGIFLAQQFPSALAAGHRVRFSGWLRTLEVVGAASIWARVDLNARPKLEYSSLAERAPQGNTQWQHFEVTVPVAKNTDSFAIGVNLIGSGTAWFSRLKLEVLDDGIVPDAKIPEIVIPPRPQPEPKLPDAVSVKLTAADIPEIPDVLRADIQRRVQPLRSFFSTDYADLQFLKPLLQDQRFLALGESGHGVAEFTFIKTRMVKFLHEQMGFDVLALEGSLTGCHDANANMERQTAAASMAQCAAGVSQTAEMTALFEYIRHTHTTARPLLVAGFDTHQYGAAAQIIPARFDAMLALIAPDMQSRVATAEAQLDTFYKQRLQNPQSVQEKLAGVWQENGELIRLIKVYTDLRAALEAGRTTLYPHYRGREQEIDVAIQEALARTTYLQQLLLGPMSKEAIALREQVMASNIKFLQKNLYAGKKVVAWGHNAHIAKQAEIYPANTYAPAFADSGAYVVGLYMGRGVAANNGRAIYEIAAPAGDTLEALLANGGYKISFIDLHRADKGPDWPSKPITARVWGLFPATIIPRQSYDALLYVDTVTPPQYR
ncbi:erythromycin esterase family protein [Massilia sp. MB5]|uniref:erythromycin esterase family protein n=1 Tax=Massilia sp. MB5 TaxID=2919578 RepID=UPI001F102BE0|nr:erythromycin esterase family protein [Massilia sp. MB5]UMR29233.1 erythromycin esterase family protein [Massilia sp. MB5]